MIVVVKKVDCCRSSGMSCLTTETVKGAALTLESVDDVEGGDGLTLGATLSETLAALAA